MVGCRWVDVVSSDSCASFGRTALMMRELPERRALRAPSDDLAAAIDAECAEVLKDCISDHALTLDESFLDRVGNPAAMDARTGVTLDMQRKMRLTGDVDDEPLSPGDMGDPGDSTLSPKAVGTREGLTAYAGAAKEGAGVASFSGFLSMREAPSPSQTEASSPSLDRKATREKKPEKAPVAAKSTKAERKGTASAPAVPAPAAAKGGAPGKGGASPAKAEKGAASKPAAKPRSASKSGAPAEKGQRVELTEPGEKGAKQAETTKRAKGVTDASGGIYFDEHTQKPLNPPKKANVQRDKVDQHQISQLLLNQFSHADAKPKAKDAPNARLCSRLKDIAIGKSTKGYQNYIRTVPIDQRSSDDPRTPNLRENVSAARFQVIYRKWRTDLHKYDNI